MIERTATVTNVHGIHCRPAAVILREIIHFPGEILVATDSGQCDLRSLLSLLSLGLERGAVVRISVSGPDEKKVCERLVELFETNFDFPPVSAETRARSVEAMLSGL